MILTFKTVDNVIFKIDVDPAEKIKCLKRRIQNDRGSEYVAEGMKLLFAGKILDDEKMISDYSISDKGFIVIMVPRPKTPGKESGKKSRSNPAQIPSISTIHENALLTPDPHFSSANPTSPLDHPQWLGQERLPRSGSSSDNEASSTPRRKILESQNSSESGLPASSSKKHSLRNSTSSQSSQHVTVTREASQEGAVSPHVVAASSTANDVPPQVVTSPLQSLDEQSKLLEVSSWLEKLVVEEPASMGEHSSNADESVAQNVQTIIEMGFEKEQAEAALNSSFNSVEGAVEYLIAGFSPPAPPEPGRQAERRVPSFAWVPPVAQQSHSATHSRRDLDDDDPLEFLQTNDEFQLLRRAVQKDPDLLPSALESFRTSHSDLEPVFEAFEDRLVELLTEPAHDSQSLAPATVAMETAHSLATDVRTPEIETPENLPAEPLHLYTESPRSLDRLHSLRSSTTDTGQRLDQIDPVRSSTTDSDRLLDLPIASDDSSLGSPVPSYSEQRVPPVGEDASAIETPVGEDLNYESFRDEEEEKLSEDLIRALLLKDEEEERMEAEKRGGAAETILWNDAETLGSGVAGGVGGRSDTGGGTGGGGGGGGRTLEERGYVRVTMEEKQAIDRLKSLGFAEEHVVQIYLACEKNEEMAANILLDKD